MPNNTLKNSDSFLRFLLSSPGNEPLLLFFLNTILIDTSDHSLRSLVVNHPPRKNLIAEGTATDDRGRLFLFEVQWNQRDHLEQAVACASLAPYPVVGFHLFDFEFLPGRGHSVLELIDRTGSRSVLPGSLWLHLVELSKIRTRGPGLTAMERLARWMTEENEPGEGPVYEHLRKVYNEFLGEE